MALETLLATGTTPGNSADKSVPQLAMHTLVLAGKGRVIVEAKLIGETYIQIAELTPTVRLIQLRGPLTYRVRRLAAFAPMSSADSPDSCGVDLYTEALVSASGLTDAQLRAAAVKTEPLGKLGGKAYQITAGAAASVSQTLTTTCTRLRLYARNANVRIAIGVGSQTATTTSGQTTSHFLAADSGVDVACDAGSSISVIRGSDQAVDGIVHVSELT